MPKFTSIDVGQEQQKAITNNLSALPGAEELTNKANKFTIDQITQLLKNTIPNYSEITSDVSTSIGSFLKGQIPQDVQDQVQMNAAAKALSGGYSGTGAQGNLVARDLGLTSLNLVQKGISSAESWLSTMDKIYAPGMMDVTSMFVSPAMQLGSDTSERDKKMGYDWFKSQLDAAHKPANIAGNSLIQTDAQLAEIVSSVAGSAGGAMCCFIFLESYNGKLPWWVRVCRDLHYKTHPEISNGYVSMAKWLVPLMRKSKVIRGIVNLLMVKPITKYGGWLCSVQGYSRCWIYRPIRNFWFAVWKRMGTD